MHTVNLLFAGDDASAEHKHVAEALVSNRNRGRVFRTFVRDSEAMDGAYSHYLFKTTNKEVHLSIGALTDTVRVSLARLIEQQMTAHNCNEIMLCEGEDTRRGIWVTKTAVKSDGVDFLLTPAN